MNKSLMMDQIFITPLIPPRPNFTPYVEKDSPCDRWELTLEGITVLKCNHLYS